MSNYYAYITDAKCPDCGCTKLVQLSSDVTCSHCGLEQGMGNFVYDTHNYYQDKYEDTFTDKPAPKKFVPDHIFNIITTCVFIAEPIIESAKELYIAYTNIRDVGNDDDRAPLVLACMYYASRFHTPLDRRYLLNSVPCVSERDFTKARNSIKERLKDDSRFKNIFCQQNNYYDITRDFNKITARNTCLPKDMIITLKRTAYHIYKKIKVTQDLVTLPPLTIAATLIYMSARKHNIKFTLKQFALDASVTATTIMKTEEKIKKAVV